MATRVMQKFGKHSVHAEWQANKAGYLYKTVKMNRQRYGEFRKYPDGSIVYWAIRKSNESVYRESAWAIDMTTFALIRMFGNPDIGILVDNGDEWRITYQKFDENKIKWDYSKHIGTLYGAKGKFGTLQWMVKFEHWDFKQGTPEAMEEQVKIRKWG